MYVQFTSCVWGAIFLVYIDSPAGSASEKSVLCKKSKQTKINLNKTLFPKRKITIQRFNSRLLQTFHGRKCDRIFATEIIEIAKFESYNRVMLQFWNNYIFLLQMKKFYSRKRDDEKYNQYKLNPRNNMSNLAMKYISNISRIHNC